MLQSVKGEQKSFPSYFIGPFIETFLAYATDTRTRVNSASGGVATTLLRYLLEFNHVDAILVPRLVVRKGVTYGVWTIVTDPSDVSKYAGSVYAPTFGLAKMIEYALKKFRRIAVTAIPCHTKVIRRLLELRNRGKDAFIIGLYCNNTPNMLATRYALNYLSIRARDIEWIKFRGYGWPGYTVIKTKNKIVHIPFLVFWDSGFGHYFYSLGCYSCTEHTNIFADISLADPWTLPREPIKKLGGATIVVVRSRRGLEVLEDAMRAGYIKAIKIDPIYAIQYATFLKLSKRVFKRYRKSTCTLPPSFTTIAHEILYGVGHFLTRRKSLWNFLKVYHKVIVPRILALSSLLDHRLVKTRWGKMHKNIAYIQRLKALKYLTITPSREDFGL